MSPADVTLALTAMRHDAQRLCAEPHEQLAMDLRDVLLSESCPHQRALQLAECLRILHQAVTDPALLNTASDLIGDATYALEREAEAEAELAAYRRERFLRGVL